MSQNPVLPDSSTSSTPLTSPSPEGTSAPHRSRSRFNAYRHGLTGQVLLFTPEQHPHYLQHCADTKAYYNPMGCIEERLVQTISDLQWRLQRATAIENSVFALGHYTPGATTGIEPVDEAFADARTWMSEAKNLSLLTLYEARLQRKLEKAIAALETEQSERIAAYQEAMTTAKRMYKAAQLNGEEYNPDPYFRRPPKIYKSVFSTDFVAREVTRDEIAHLTLPPRILDEIPEFLRRKQAA